MDKHILLAVLATASYAYAQTANPAITTGQYNTSRTSANLNETLLNTTNVNVNQFGKLFSWPVDGWIFAQPLYVPGVIIGGKATNVVYVATMLNSVYAFNADSSSSTPIWHKTFGSPVTAPTANGCPANWSTGATLGILSTPVIDPSKNTMYFVSASPSPGGYVHNLHAIDITTGVEKSGSPVQIQASVPGTGYNAQNGRVSISTASTEIQRTALLLANGSVYAGFGNCGPDTDPWHGWIVGYSTSNLATQTALFNSTPNGGQGGIWQSGRGLVADPAGDLYFSTGNATNYNARDAGVTSGSSSGDAAKNNYAMRLVQLSSKGQFMGSYPPINYSALNNNDLDFSSSGPLLIPGTTTLVAGGKDGLIYTFNAGNLTTPVQSFQAAGGGACGYSMDGCAQIHDLAFWNNHLYVWASKDVLRVYDFSGSRFNTTPSSQNAITTTYHPAGMAVSANSTQTGSGILWALTPDNILHAFNASNVATELWNSTRNAGRDALPSYAKFVEPTVANGRVYAATHSNQVAVYGLLRDFSLSSPTQAQSVNRGSSTSLTVNVTALAGLSGAVTLSASGLPAGATATFSPASLAGSGTSTLSIKTASTTPTGTYNVIISATAGSVTRTVSLSLNVIIASDTTPPSWTCCIQTTNGSSSVWTYTAWDTQSGMKSIQGIQIVNSTVAIPPFTPGTTSQIKFSTTQSGWSSYVKFQLTDVAGNISYIDPVWVDAARSKGAPQGFYVKRIMPEEGWLTIQNGSPGLKNVRIDFPDGIKVGHVQVAGLKDREVRYLDIRPYLSKDGTSLTITPLGKPGGSAQFTFATYKMTVQ